MKAWYKKLGYYENPFLINPLRETTKLYGYDKELEDALYYVTSGTILFVEGAAGMGKTKFLRSVINNFRGRIIYVNAAKLKKNLDIEELLRKKNGVKGKLLGKKPKQMILLLDNVEELSVVNIERLKYYFDQSFLQSVVIAGTSLQKANFPQSFMNRIGKRVIELKPMDKKDALAMAFERLDEDPAEEDSLITPKQVETIFEKSKANPKQFLLNLHRVFEEMDFEDAQKVEAKHLKILDDKLDNEDETEYYISLGADVVDEDEIMVDGKGNKLMKVGEYYRCPVYDMFCGNCGAIVKSTDQSCPECQAEFENAVAQEESEEAPKEKKSKKGEAHA